jgi:hypothetical protein
MSWEAIAGFGLVAVTLAGLNVGAIKWMFESYRETVVRETSRWEQIERSVYELRASMPIEYVRREDWIRFSGTLDAKLDVMREEMRQEISAIKEKLYAGRD